VFDEKLPLGLCSRAKNEVFMTDATSTPLRPLLPGEKPGEAYKPPETTQAPPESPQRPLLAGRAVSVVQLERAVEAPEEESCINGMANCVCCIAASLLLVAFYLSSDCKKDHCLKAVIPLAITGSMLTVLAIYMCTYRPRPQ
jgi:hypothetical protein